MKQALKLLLLISITAVLAGCKLAIIVVEGGVVGSTDSGTCTEGTICIIEVNDTNFSETFYAYAEEGWYFEKWNSGGGFLCADSSYQVCTFSLEGAEGNTTIEAVVASSETFYLMPIFRLSPDTITVEGKEWRQPYLFKSLTWQDIHAVCPAGVCYGTLNGYDMTGWTWASIDDVNALFNHYIGFNELGPGPDRTGLSPSEASEASDFFSDGWQLTFSLPPQGYAPSPLPWYGVSGWLRSIEGETKAYRGIAGMVPGELTFGYSSTSHLLPAHTDLYTGGWFYRNL